MKRAVDIFIIAIVCIVPLIINIFSLEPFYSPKLVAIYILCIVILLFYLLKREKNKLQNNILDYIIFLYLFIVFLSTLFSVDIIQSITGRVFIEEGTVAITCYILIYYFASKYFTFTEKHLKYLSISAMIISIYGIAQFFGYDPIPRDYVRENWLNHSFSTLGNRNFLGSYLTLVIPVVLFGYLYYKKVIYALVSYVLFLCLLCTLTRGAWLGFALSLGIMGYYVYVNKAYMRRFILAVLIFGGIALCFNSITNGAVFGRFLTIGKDINSVVVKSSAEKAGSGRIFIWKRAIMLISDNPYLGSGPNTFGNVFMNKFGEETIKALSTSVSKAHNEYLQIAVTTGMISLAIYLIFIAIIIFIAIKRSSNKIILIPLVCSLSGYLVQAFFNISIVSVAPIYWAFIGITVGNFEKDNL